MTTYERLVALKKLLFGDETRWVQGSPAEDERGNPVATRDKGAVRFCLLGGAEHIVAMEFAGTDGDYDPKARESDLAGIAIALSDAIKRVGFEGRTKRMWLTSYGEGDPMTRVIRFNDHENTNAADARLVIESAMIWNLGV